MLGGWVGRAESMLPNDTSVKDSGLSFVLDGAQETKRKEKRKREDKEKIKKLK